MAVSDQLLCSFELLKPLDSSALKSHIKKGRNKRQNMLNSPVSAPHGNELKSLYLTGVVACYCICAELLIPDFGLWNAFLT